MATETEVDGIGVIVWYFHNTLKICAGDETVDTWCSGTMGRREIYNESLLVLLVPPDANEADVVDWERGASEWAICLLMSLSTVPDSVMADWRLWQINDDSAMNPMPGWKPKVKPRMRK